MAIFAHNSLTKAKEPFSPIKEPGVNMYTCGVTVYDACHIGHARSLYTFDLMRRYLKYRGFDVKFVRNITDIDDKIINRARELKTDWRELSERYIKSYYEDLKALSIDRADCEPRATENIADMIKHIEGLIAKGYAYVTASGVYFNVRKFKGYGRLSGQSIDQMNSGVRIEPDETKADPLDFALWKSSKADEPAWDSPWGKGRPGWHIECSVMSTKYLGTDTLDIHAGGRDLIFPHHENEIAQAEALTAKPFARYWIHHGLLTINGQKMSKSLGNFVTIRDFMSRHKNADFLKLFFLSAHYSHPIDYTEEKIEEAKKACERISIMLNKVDRFFKDYSREEKDDLEKSTVNNSKVRYPKSLFEQAMDDDFNTPQALAVLQNVVSDINITITQYPQVSSKDISKQQMYYNRYILFPELSNVLGLDFGRASESGEYLSDEIEGLIKKRNEARANKDFKLADKIRIELEKNGIILEDSKEGTTWRRKL